MKSIAPAAMAAIEAGEAIVTGAVEITPIVSITEALLAAVDSSWKYKTEAPGSPADYSAAAYDDSAWASGNGGFGNQAPGFAEPFNTVLFGGVSPITAGDIIWIRKTLGPLDALPITLDVWHDDGAAAWFNGIAVALAAVDSFHARGTIASGLVNTSGNNVIAIKVTDSVPSGTPAAIYAGAQVTQEVVGAGGTPIRLWGGYGNLTFATDTGDQQFAGVGAYGLAQNSAGTIGGIAQGLTLSLSGIEAAAIDLLDADEIKGASVVLYRLIFANDGKTLLDAHVFDRGRVDTVQTNETIGGTASIDVAVESSARGLGRAGGRTRSDSDQRLISSTDGYFKSTAYAGQKELYWGGKRPSSFGRGS